MERWALRILHPTIFLCSFHNWHMFPAIERPAPDVGRSWLQLWDMLPRKRVSFTVPLGVRFEQISLHVSVKTDAS